MSIDPIINETPINIILETNIPNELPFSLTKNILHNKLLDKSGYSEYPYFSSWIPYPREILVKMDYADQVDFFFKKDDFINILKNTSTYKNLLKQKEELRLMNIKNNRKFQTNPNENNQLFILDKTEQNNNIRNNIMIMLTLLFPISFPTKDNITNSYDALFLNTSNISSVSSIIPLLLNIMLGVESNKQKYSYIQSPSKGICTVTQIVWLNDIYNHPEYKKIILQYQSFQLWKSNEKNDLNIKIDNEMNLYKNGKYEKIWNELLTMMESMDENEIPTSVNSYYKYSKQYSNNPRNDFNKMKNLLNNRENIINNKKYEDLFKIKKYYNSLNNINITRSLFYNVKNIRLLFSSIEQIQVNYNIINKYLDNDSISLEMEDTTNMTQDERIIDEKIKQWNGYKKYSEFINLLKIFNRANNQSTNDVLQNVIDNFILKNAEDKRFELMLIPSNSKLDNIIKLVETGITIKKSNPIKNTIYVHMDVIVGEIDDSNKNSINCVYNKDYLGSELKSLLKSKDKFWEVNNNRFLFDLNTMKTIENNQSEKKEITLKEPSIKNPTEYINLKNSKGGNKKRLTRKNRQ
jgi:hypothetical protein